MYIQYMYVYIYERYYALAIWQPMRRWLSRVSVRIRGNEKDSEEEVMGEIRVSEKRKQQYGKRMS